MTGTLTITLSDDQLKQLKEIASGFDTTPEELVRVIVVELVAHHIEEFQQALIYVLHKNAELYERLA